MSRHRTLSCAQRCAHSATVRTIHAAVHTCGVFFLPVAGKRSRSDGSTHRTQRHTLNRLLHISSYARRADCPRLLRRRRFLQASPKQSYPWRSSCKTYSSSFDSKPTLPDHSRRQHTLVDHRLFPVSESPGLHTGAVESSVRINVPVTLWRHDRPNYIVFAKRLSGRRTVINSKKADAVKSFNDSTVSASLSARIANNKKSRHSESFEGFHRVGLLFNSPTKIFGHAIYIVVRNISGLL